MSYIEHLGVLEIEPMSLHFFGRYHQVQYLTDSKHILDRNYSLLDIRLVLRWSNFGGFKHVHSKNRALFWWVNVHLCDDDHDADDDDDDDDAADDDDDDGWWWWMMSLKTQMFRVSRCIVCTICTISSGSLHEVFQCIHMVFRFKQIKYTFTYTHSQYT